MKKILYALLLLAIIAGSLWTGSRLAQREALKIESQGAKSQAVNAGGQPGTDAGSRTDIDTSSSPPGTVGVSLQKQQAIGIRTGIVEKKPAALTLRVLGRVAADETKIYRVNASVDGWIKEAPSHSIGTQVKKAEVLAIFYSPAFLDAQQSYLYALGAVDRGQLGKRLELGRKENPAQIALDQLTVQRFIDNLRGLGMGDPQIEEIGRTRQITQDIWITSPGDGFITARNVSPGQRFLKGAELFQIADLGRVWILADLFEQEAQHFKPGVKATVHLPQQKKTYQATVTKVLPIFDPTTRTLRIRLEADNPGFLLRSDMFVDVELPISLPPAIAVPADAVLDSGIKKTVFVDLGNGMFEPREVETGWRMGNQVEITKGLQPGEKIVVSGNFLIDSESRMELATAGMAGALGKDPVCGMEVAVTKAAKAGRRSGYKGTVYYFCSDECKVRFEKNPSKYTEKK